MTEDRRDSPPRRWRSQEEREGTFVPFDPNEDVRRSLLELPFDEIAPSRRSFLKLAGFGVATATLAACTRATVEKAIPLLVRPEPIVPGKSYWVATTCAGCPAGCGARARCRDGRPLKLEGNPQQPVGRGGLCAVGQAQILSLYDSHRLDGPRERGAKTTWSAADRAIRAQLDEVRARGGRVRVLTGTENSPSTLAAMARFLGRFDDGRHVMYDAASCSAILAAHEATHGVRALPRFLLENAKVMVAFDADFLGAWISPVEHMRGRQAARDPAARDRFARHVQFESRMTLTGGRADRRVKLGPWEIGRAVGALVARLARLAGVNLPLALPSLEGQLGSEVDRAADELWAARGRALLLCGTNDLRVQKLVNYGNELLGAYGATLDLEAPSRQRLGDDRELSKLRRELADGAVDVLVIAGCNPAYELPDAQGFADAVARVELVIACSTHEDETAALARFVLPAPHFLEAWNDAEPFAGLLSFSQPLVPPLKDARMLRRTLSSWVGDERDDRALVEATFAELVAARGAAASAPAFERALHDGFALVLAPASRVKPFQVASLEPPLSQQPPAEALALVLHPKVAVPDGRHAHNPWLQELPDPVSKVVWDNYAAIAPSTAQRLGIATGDVVRVSVAVVAGATLASANEQSIEIPALVQPGQHEAVVAIALGYGRKGTDRFTTVGPRWLEAKPTVLPGGLVGVDAAPLLVVHEELLRADVRSVVLAPTGRRVDLACTQDHHTLSVPEHLAPAGGATRDAVRTVSLTKLLSDPQHAIEHERIEDAELWASDHAAPGPRWGMAIDLSACTGCSACVVGCQAENNVPVVGKDEVRRHREMHWIRIDRYWQGEPEAPSALHQPMMCQHCGHAPCETVCPVLATVHSRDGLNQQVYNRCVGTRYCANNCPYKVRRFNWFDYPHEDRLQNLALNPDVTVRSRGVMEKCSFCVQRILEAKLLAQEESRAPADGDVQPACQQTCPAQAIVFGDLNDPGSRVAQLARNGRAYRVLEELNVQPAVSYLADVRDAAEATDGA